MDRISVCLALFISQLAFVGHSHLHSVELSADPGRSVGVPASMRYVDFKFIGDTGALNMNSTSKIYLVPLQPGSSIAIEVVKSGMLTV